MSYVSGITTIQIKKTVVERLKKVKKYERQTYSEIINELISVYKERQGQYDKFLHAIQQEKMKELWDNGDDEVWGHA